MESNDKNPLKICYEQFNFFFENHVLPRWKRGFEYFKGIKTLDIRSLNYEKHIYIRDPIWGEIRLNQLELIILDSFFVQRLRYIAQMGGTPFVYPSANHRRFDHSLGTFAAISLILDEKILKRRQKDYKENIKKIYQEYKLLNPKISKIFEEKNEKDYKNNEFNFFESFRLWILLNLKLSMLMHDIGHYPFSHSFEIFLKRNQNLVNSYRTNESNFVDKPHEYRSKQIINGDDPVLNHFINGELTGLIKIFLENHDLDVELISKSIIGKHSFVLSQLINGVLDADKMDYLTRDNYFAIASFPLAVFDRIYRRAKFKKIDDSEQIKMIFDDKAVSAILKIILTRTFEFNDIVNHPVQLCFQAMFHACLERVFQQFEVKLQIEILKRMEMMNDEELLHSISILGNGNHLIRNLLYGISFRKLYKQVGYYPKSKLKHFMRLMKDAQKESLFIDADALTICLNKTKNEEFLSPLITAMRENDSGLLIFYNEYLKSIGKNFDKILIELKDNKIISLKKFVDERYKEHFSSFLDYSVKDKEENHSVADLFDFFTVLDNKVYVYAAKPLLKDAKSFFNIIENDEKAFINFFNKISECI